MFRTARWGIAATVAALLLAAPATAKERSPQDNSPAPVPVPVQGGGEGIAPNAPEAVKVRITKLLAGADTRATQGVARSSWIGCRAVYAWRGYSNPLGMSLFRYYQQVSWCSNGYGIYSWSRDRWPEIGGLGWRFDGHIGSSLGGNSIQKNAWTQGSFTGCIFGLCQTRVPWVSITVRVDGSFGWNTGD
jgi:hypothetical protein